MLYGEESYLKQQYKEKLKKALVQEDDSMNFSMFEGKKTEPKAIIDLAETMPFFADRRVIFLEVPVFSKTSVEIYRNIWQNCRNISVWFSLKMM